MRKPLVWLLVLLLVPAAAGLLLSHLWKPRCPKDPQTLKQWLRAAGREECLGREEACRELTFDRLAQGLNRSDRRILGMVTPPGSSDAKALFRLVEELRGSYRCPAPERITRLRESPGERLRLLARREGLALAGESGLHAQLFNDPRLGTPDLEGLARALAGLATRFPAERELLLVADGTVSLDLLLIAQRLAREAGGGSPRFEPTTVLCQRALEASSRGCPEWERR
jgi:hypothetical protein